MTETERSTLDQLGKIVEKLNKEDQARLLAYGQGMADKAAQMDAQ